MSLSEELMLEHKVELKEQQKLLEVALVVEKLMERNRNAPILLAERWKEMTNRPLAVSEVTGVGQAVEVEEVAVAVEKMANQI